MKDASPSDKDKVSGDNKLLMQSLMLVITSTFVQHRVIPFLEEHPRPAKEYLPETHPHAKAPSFWLTKTWLEFARVFGMMKVSWVPSRRSQPRSAPP